MAEPTVRERLFEATYACAARYGIAKTTVEDVARQARLSRATVYRHFPGGKDQLINETVAWESARFFTRLADAVAGVDDLTTLLEEAVFFAHKALQEHAVLQKILQTEPERLLPELTVESGRLITLIQAFLLPYLQRENLPDDVDVGVAGQYIARMFLSFMGAPGSWDLSDREQIREVVRTQLLGGVRHQ